MAKTKVIHTVAANALVCTNNAHTVSVTLNAPDVPDILGEIHEEDLISYINAHHTPEDIFPETQLEKWAEANGYVKGGDK